MAGRAFLLRAAAVVACLAVDSAAQRPQKQSRGGDAGNRIVGGTLADISDVPYQVSLRNFGSHFCGGSLIDPRYVVTACHCVDGQDVESLTIRAGTDCRVYGGQVVQVSRITMHPAYDPTSIDHDVAVLELAEPVTHPDAAVVELATETPPDGCTAVISGWGTLREGGARVPFFLRKAKVLKVSDCDCKESYGETAITSTMACYGNPGGGVDSCQGDSGGPAVVDKKLAGIVSWGYGCAREDYPGVYTNVASVLPFICDVVEKRDNTTVTPSDNSTATLAE